MSQAIQSTEQTFTVLAVDSHTGQIRVFHVQARNGMHAFSKVAEDESNSVEFVASMPGHLTESVGLVLPGECVVFSETVREQDDVFA